MTDILYRHWVASALAMAIMTLALLPLLVDVWSLQMRLIYLHIPVYILHQVEEHAGDRFRRFANDKIGKTRRGLSPSAVLWINLPGVWGVNLAALFLARAGLWSLALLAPAMLVINALVHIIGAIRFKGYNPGLTTAVILFLPLAIWSYWEIDASWTPGLTGALLLHALIVLYATRLSPGPNN